jgi:hypothetical protein
MPTDELPIVPDSERFEPRVRDDQDPDQGPPIEDQEAPEDEEAPAAGVLDPERPEPPEPNEPA